jgi:hypothetical protein
MLCIKDHYPSSKFETVFYSLFPAIWVPPQSDLSNPANLRVSHVPLLLPNKIFKDKLDFLAKTLRRRGSGRDHRWGWNARVQEEIDRYHKNGG